MLVLVPAGLHCCPGGLGAGAALASPQQLTGPAPCLPVAGTRWRSWVGGRRRHAELTAPPLGRPRCRPACALRVLCCAALALRVTRRASRRPPLFSPGYGPEESSTVFELTYNYGKTSYSKGNAYAQVAISTQVRGGGGGAGAAGGAVQGACLRQGAVPLPARYRLPAPRLRAASLLAAPESLHRPFPLLLREHRNPTQPNPHPQDVYKTADQIKAAGGTVTREPGPVPGIGTKIVACTDPGGRQRLAGGRWAVGCADGRGGGLCRWAPGRAAERARACCRLVAVHAPGLSLPPSALAAAPMCADGYKIVFVDEQDFLKELEQQ